MPEAKSLKDLMKIREFNKDKLESINSNFGTAICYNTNENGKVAKSPAIIVLLPKNKKWLSLKSNRNFNSDRIVIFHKYFDL